MRRISVHRRITDKPVNHAGELAGAMVLFFGSLIGWVLVFLIADWLRVI